MRTLRTSGLVSLGILDEKYHAIARAKSAKLQNVAFGVLPDLTSSDLWEGCVVHPPSQHRMAYLSVVKSGLEQFR